MRKWFFYGFCYFIFEALQLILMLICSPVNYISGTVQEISKSKNGPFIYLITENILLRFKCGENAKTIIFILLVSFSIQLIFNLKMPKPTGSRIITRKWCTQIMYDSLVQVIQIIIIHSACFIIIIIIILCTVHRHFGWQLHIPYLIPSYLMTDFVCKNTK